MKAYQDHPSDNVHNVYDAPHLQESAACWFTLAPNELTAVRDAEVSSRKYARARFAMGLREADYGWESHAG